MSLIRNANQNKDSLPATRALNSDQLFLNSTYASELGFNPDPNPEPWENAEVLAIPRQWFLTQVGTTLSQAVNASRTTFHVKAVKSAMASRRLACSWQEIPEPYGYDPPWFFPVAKHLHLNARDPSLPAPPKVRVAQDDTVVISS